MAEPLKYRRPHPDAEASPFRSKLQTPGFSDELGDRQVSFEPGSESCIEVLRFSPRLAESAAFESAVRARVDECRALRHPSLADAHFVERRGAALSLESRVPSGRRLFEVASPHNGWTFALDVVRDVLPALVALNDAGGAAHGALSTHRIITTRDGRYVLSEHVLGTALESLALSRTELRALGIVVPNGSGPARFTESTDLMQLGYLTLSLLVGRPLAVEDFPARVPAWLDEFVMNAGSPIAAAQVRGWLERAMQADDAPAFASVRDAQTAFDELSKDVSVQGAESVGALLAFASETAPSEPDQPARPAVPAAKPAAIANVETAKATPPKTAATPVKPAKAIAAKPAATRGRSRVTTWIVSALSVLALAEGAVIAGLLYWRPTVEVQVLGPRRDDAPIVPALPASTWPGGQSTLAPAPPSTPATTTPVASPTPKPATTAIASPIVAARVGGLTVTSAIELQVLKNGTAIGSTAAPLAIADGRYTFDFVNPALGYHVALPVTITGGQMTNLKVPVPNGRVSINAVPWAQVTIDGKDMGQTPLANVLLPIGSHDVVFTHPQFGERRQAVVVKVDGIARVTQNFR